MTWAGVAVGVVSLVGAGINYFGGKKSSDAAKSASQQQAASSRYAADMQYKMWQEQNAQQQPWVRAGTNALRQMNAGLQQGGQFASYPKFQAPTLSNDPGYQWRLQQGVNALDASAAGSGSFGSGNLGVALQNYGQGLGSQEYGAAYNRAVGEYNMGYGQNTDLYNRLAGLSGTGQSTAAGLGAMGMNTATQMGNYNMQGANALAAGQMYGVQAQNAGIQGAWNQLNQGAGNYMNYLQNQQWLAQNQFNNFGGWNASTGGTSTPYGYESGGMYGNLPGR